MGKGMLEFEKKESSLIGNKFLLVTLVFMLTIINYVIINVDLAHSKVKYFIHSIKPEVVKHNNELKIEYEVQWETHKELVKVMEKEI